MGRTPLSWGPVLLRLRAEGHQPKVFAYCAAVESFASIRGRLLARLQILASHGPYVLVGHSLGGVLLRDALNRLPPGVPMPRHLFLLGSPVRPARLARKLRGTCLYRLLTGDAGQALASGRRMGAIGPAPVPTTAITGTRGIQGASGPFGREPNDGVVAASESSADWADEALQVPVVHTLLPASSQVAEILLARLSGQ